MDQTYSGIVRYIIISCFTYMSFFIQSNLLNNDDIISSHMNHHHNSNMKGLTQQLFRVAIKSCTIFDKLDVSLWYLLTTRHGGVSLLHFLHHSFFAKNKCQSGDEPLYNINQERCVDRVQHCLRHWLIRAGEPSHDYNTSKAVLWHIWVLTLIISFYDLSSLCRASGGQHNPWSWCRFVVML